MYDHVNQMNDGGHALLMLGIVNIHMCFIRIRLKNHRKMGSFFIQGGFFKSQEKMDLCGF